jgi:hypothetical protein
VFEQLPQMRRAGGRLGGDTMPEMLWWWGKRRPGREIPQVGEVVGGVVDEGLGPPAAFGVGTRSVCAGL